jgi:two-component system sensor kinase FixL
VSEKEFPKQRLLLTLDKISEQALRAAEVIRRLRAFVKKRKAQREFVDLNQLIAETVELASIDTRLLDHGITLNLSQELPSLLLIDPIQIQQVLFNLIRNAIDAMAEQTNDPIQIYSQKLDQHFIEVGVIDSGLGIKEQDKAMLFIPFFTTKNVGMGMGLPISQSIIQAHGGELKHHSRASRGSIFSFTLPVSSELTGDEKANEQ